MKREVTMRHQPSIVLAFVSILLLLSIKPYEACRSVPREDEQHLLLPSLQWKAVMSPAVNPGTDKAVAGKKKKRGSLKKYLLLLPSLQWNPVTPPTPNPGTNSALAGEKNFAATLSRRKKSSASHLLLPSLQWRPVKPPSNNPGHNLKSP